MKAVFELCSWNVMESTLETCGDVAWLGEIVFDAELITM